MLYDNIQDQFQNILDTNEKILWSAKPVFIPFIVSGIPFLAFGVFWAYMDYGFIKQSLISGNMTQLPFLLLHLFPFWLSLLNMSRLIFSYHNNSYVITDKRILIRMGVWGIDYQAIDYDKVNDVQVNVNFVEKLFNVGSILINTGLNMGPAILYKLSAIPNPYEAFKKIKSTTVDIKTDWNYPNKLRPDKNSGYKTEYSE